LVVGVQRRGAAHDLRVALVTARDVDADGDRLVGLVGGDGAHARLRRPGTVLARRRALAIGLRGLLLTLLLAPPRARGGLGLARLGALLGRGQAALTAAGAGSDLALLRRRRSDRRGGRG